MRVAPLSYRQQFELTFISIFRMATWLLIFGNFTAKKPDFTALFFVLGNFVAIFKLFEAANYRAKPLREEAQVENSDMRIHLLDSDDLFSFTRPVDDFLPEPCRAKKVVCTDIGEDIDDSLKFWTKAEIVRINVGQETILQHTLNLQKALKNCNYNLVLSSKFGTIRKMWPHWSGPDMATKARFMDYLLFPSVLAAKSLMAISTPYNYSMFIWGYALAALMMAMRESYILNDHELRLNLEGYAFSKPSWCDLKSTCIGLQLTRKIHFDPANSELTAAIKNIKSGEKALRERQQVGEKYAAYLVKLGVFVNKDCLKIIPPISSPDDNNSIPYPEPQCHSLCTPSS